MDDVMDASSPKIEKQAIAGAYISILHTLVRTIHGELVYVQVCTVSLFQSGWFGNKKFLLQPSSAPDRGRTAQRKT